MPISGTNHGMANEDSGITRATRFAELGHQGNLTTANRSQLEQAVVNDSDPRARSAALGALFRAESIEILNSKITNAPARIETQALMEIWLSAASDEHAVVRKRTAELGPIMARVEIALGTDNTPDKSPANTPDKSQDKSQAGVVVTLIDLLNDDEITVVEATAWALGEGVESGTPNAAAVAALARTVTNHDNALAREAAVAALGALRDPVGLPAILIACGDKPAVRRRAVLALAPFTGNEVDQAIETATQDRDPQVRQAAEILRKVVDD